MRAPLATVFRTVADVTEFRKAIPHIVNVEFLSAEKLGKGTRFRETRLMNGRRVTTELNVVDYVENDYIRLKANKNGTLWDTVFAVREENGLTRLSLVLDAKPYEWLPQLMSSMWSGILKQAMENDMDEVRKYCENASAASAP